MAPRGPGGELEVEVLLGERVEIVGHGPNLHCGAPRDVGRDASRRNALRSGERPGDTAVMTATLTLPLVEQLRFTRSEFRRGLRGTPEPDAVRRLEPMNSIGWIVAHMAWHEQRYWLTRGLGETPPGSGPKRTIGSAIQRVTYHYWFHTGEILAIRQVLVHARLPEFVGNIDAEAPYRAG